MNKTLKEIKKGDSVYVFSDDSRHKSFEGTAISVGAKYITVEEGTGGRRWKFDRETRMCVEWSIYYVYKDKSEADARVKREEMRKFVHQNISRALVNMSDEDFETIHDIISKYIKK